MQSRFFQDAPPRSHGRLLGPKLPRQGVSAVGVLDHPLPQPAPVLDGREFHGLPFRVVRAGARDGRVLTAILS